MKHTYHISGMTCNGCKAHVEQSLSALSKVESVSIDLQTETAEIIMTDHVSLDELQGTLEGTVYQVHPESAPRPKKKLEPMPAIKKKGTYYCPMHCEGDKTYPVSGSCPVCGMDLVPLASASDDQLEDKTYQLLIRKFKVAVGFTLPIFVIAMSEMWPGNILFDLMSIKYWNWVQFVLSIPVVFYATWMFFERAYASLISRFYNMFTLIGIGAGIAWVFSVIGMIVPDLFPEQFRNESGSVHMYFESTTVILTLVLLGQVLEAGAHSKTSSAIKALLRLAPNKAYKIVEGVEYEIPTDQIMPGDLIRVKPGDKVPVDGTIEQGESVIDESMITGEPMPVDKGEGDQVNAGTINGSHAFIMLARKVGKDTLLSQIIDMVNEASRSKAPIQKLADKISAYFVPAVVLVSLLTFTVWAIFGPEPRWVYALVNAIAVLIIACPCALGLATPMSVMVGVGRGAEAGVLIKDAESLQKMAKIDTLIIDKTGTVTEGRPSVEQIISYDVPEDTLLQYLGSVNQLSEHPLAAATVAYVKEKNSNLVDVKAFESVAGKGVSAKIDGIDIAIGNQKMMSDQKVQLSDSVIRQASDFQSAGKTVSYIAADHRLIGVVVLGDQIKRTSKEAIHQLQSSGIEIIMMTGDNARTARSVGDILEINQVIAECMPEDKMEKVRDLKARGKSVAMAGDGINDAPALALADVGIAMGTGTDVAMESASVTLVKGDLKGVVRARSLSLQVMKNIHQNLFFALIYNGLGVPVAAGIMYPFFGILLSPMIAALAMSFSSVSVIVNALRLRAARLG